MSGVEEGTDPTPSVSKRKSIQAKVATRAIKSSVNPSKKFIVARKKRTANLKKKIRNKRKRLLKKQSKNENYHALGLEGYE